MWRRSDTAQVPFRKGTIGMENSNEDAQEREQCRISQCYLRSKQTSLLREDRYSSSQVSQCYGEYGVLALL